MFFLGGVEAALSKVRFMNTYIDNLTMGETVEQIEKIIQKREASYVVTPNVDHIVQLEKDYLLQSVYEHAGLVVADGQPMIWISRLYKRPIKEKVSGSDLFLYLCDMCAKKGYSLFILGAAEGVGLRAANNLKETYKGLNIAGVYSPKYGFESDEEELARIKSEIAFANPDVLIVALGSPKQEYFMYKYYKELNVPISLGLGAAVDFAAGEQKRAPKWMQKYGLEWFYRVLREPKRMTKRYFKDFIYIIPMIAKYGKNKV